MGTLNGETTAISHQSKKRNLYCTTALCTSQITCKYDVSLVEDNWRLIELSTTKSVEVKGMQLTSKLLLRAVGLCNAFTQTSATSAQLML